LRACGGGLADRVGGELDAAGQGVEQPGDDGGGDRVQGVILVVGQVGSVVFAGQVPGPVGVEVAVADQGA